MRLGIFARQRAAAHVTKQQVGVRERAKVVVGERGHTVPMVMRSVHLDGSLVG